MPTREQSRWIGQRIIEIRAERENITQVEAMQQLAPRWWQAHAKAVQEGNVKRAEHLGDLIKMCD